MEVITNKEALEESPVPSPVPWTRSATMPVSPLVVAAATQQEPARTNINTASPPPSNMYVAKYHFTGSTMVELSLKKGDKVNVFEKSDNGWWKGVLGGQVGWFPETYVRPPYPEELPAPEVEQPRGMDEMLAAGGEEFEASG